MVELQGKIALFRNMIWSEEKKNSEEKLYASSEQYTDLIDRRRESLQKEKENYISQHVDRAERKAREELAVHKQENQRVFLETQRKCLEALHESIREKFRNFVKTPAYQEWMRKHLKVAMDEMDVAVVHVLDADRELVMDIFGSVVEIQKMDPSEMGGFVLVNRDRTKRTRHTFAYLLDANAYEIGRTLHEWLRNGVVQEAEATAQEMNTEVEA